MKSTIENFELAVRKQWEEVVCVFLPGRLYWVVDFDHCSYRQLTYVGPCWDRCNLRSLVFLDGETLVKARWLAVCGDIREARCLASQACIEGKNVILKRLRQHDLRIHSAKFRNALSNCFACFENELEPEWSPYGETK